ncbi:MAG: hypothetical protein OXE44_11865 [Nitrospinae bacterium]|nr:hypothetical protein [Nitrospinota bacterium]
MRILVACVVSMALVAGGAGGKGHDGRKSPVKSVSPQGHCRSFAVKWAENGKFSLSPASVRAERKSFLESVVNSLFDLVSPAGSTFTGGYDCRFRVKERTGGARDVSVDLLLAETPGFAEHTQWRKLQIVPIRHVVDEANDMAGYGVFKYLKDEPAD